MSTAATVTGTKEQRTARINAKADLISLLIVETIITSTDGGRMASRYTVNYKGVEYSRDRKSQHIWANQGAVDEKIIKFNTGFSLKLFVYGVANYLIEKGLV